MSVPSPTAVIVGTGFIGPVHLEALRRQGISVRGMLGSTPERSAAAAERFNLAVGYATFSEVLQDPAVDVVHLTSPNRFHYEQVLAALDANKHVVCEKPLGLTSVQTAALVAAAAAKPHLVCAVNYNLRFYPLMLHARTLIQRGDLGRVLHLHGSYQQDWLLYPTDFNWRVLPEDGGAVRAVGDIGTHWLDLAHFVTGLEISELCADLCTVHPERQRPVRSGLETFSRKPGHDPASHEPVAVTTEDVASILFRGRGGERGAVTISQVTAGRKNSVKLEIAGTRQSLAWDSEQPDSMWLGQRDAPNQMLLRDPSLMTPPASNYTDYPAGHAEGFPDTFKQLYRAIYADIRAGRASPQPLYATFADGHRELLLCEAVALSHRNRGWVQVPG